MVVNVLTKDTGRGGGGGGGGGGGAYSHRKSMIFNPVAYIYIYVHIYLDIYIYTVESGMFPLYTNVLKWDDSTPYYNPC